MSYTYWCSATVWMWIVVALAWLFIPVFDSPFPSEWEAIDQTVVAVVLLLGAILISWGMYR